MTSQLVIDCLAAAPQPHAASPALSLRLRVAELTGVAVQSIALRCQVRIQAPQRTYTDAEAGRLSDIFGDRAAWGASLQSLHLATVTSHVPGFTGSIETDLHLPVSYDLEVAAGRYFDALAGGVIPLQLLFSGTVFQRDPASGALTASQVPWHKEATYRLPVTVWRELIDQYFPNSGWLRLDRDTLAGLARYKSAHALTTWDDTIRRLLKHAGEEDP